MREPSALRGLAHFLRRLVFGILTGLYLLVSRTIVFISAVYLTLYFLSGTSSFKAAIQQEISQHLPGTITAATVQWGPLPWEVRVADGRVFDDLGREVVKVDAVVAELAIMPTFSGMLRGITDDAAPFALIFNHADVAGGHANVHVDAQGNVGIERAFHIPDGSAGEPDNFDIRSRSVRVIDASGLITSPGYRLEIDGVSAVTSFAMTGDADIDIFVPRLQAKRADSVFSADTRPDLALRPLVATTEDVVVTNGHMHKLKISWDHVEATVAGGRLSSSGEMDVEPTPVTWNGSAQLSLPEGSAVTAGFTAQRVHGPVELALRGMGTVEQADARIEIASPALEMAGMAVKDFGMSLRMTPRGTPDNPYRHAWNIERVDAEIFDGKVTLTDAYYGPVRAGAGSDQGEPADYFEGRLLLSGVDAEGLMSEVLATPTADTTPYRGRLSGELSFKGNHRDKAGTLDVAAMTEGLDYEWAGMLGVPLDGRYTIVGAVDYQLDPRGLDVAGEHVVGTSLLDLTKLTVDSGPTRVRVSGSVDFATGQLKIEPYLRLGDLRQIARRFGLREAAGRLVLKEASLGGTFSDPKLRARMNWTKARFGATDLGRIRAQLGLSDGTLSLTRAQAENALGKFDLDGQIRLFTDATLGTLDRQLPFRISRLRSTGLDLSVVFPELGSEARLDVAYADLAGRLADPLRSLVGQARLATRDVALGHELVKKARFNLRATDTRFSLNDVQLTLASGQRASGSLVLFKGTDRLNGRIRVQDMPFSALRTVRVKRVPLSGALDADLSIGGSLRTPSFIGRVNLSDITYDQLSLGTAELDLQTEPSGRIDLSSARFFPGFELMDGSGVEMAGFMPRHVSVRVKGDQARLTQVVPGMSRGELQITTSARAVLDFWPMRAGKNWDLAVTAEPGEVEIGLRAQGITYRNRTPLSLDQGSRGAHLEPVSFAATDTRADERGPGTPAPRDEHLTVCGDLLTDGSLDFRLAGALDLGILATLKDVFSVLEGRLRIAEDPATIAALGKRRCLTEGGADAGVLHITGTTEDPRLSGRLETVGVSLIPRSMGREIRLADGHGIELRPGKVGEDQRVTSSEDRGVRGELDDGTFQVHGDLVLQRLGIRDADLEFVGADLFFASPGEFNLTFTPNAFIRVRDFHTPSPELSLSGEVRVTEGRYYKSFDALGEAFGGAVLGRSDSYSTPITEQFPWLKQLQLNIDITSTEFDVDSAFPLGKAEMDARLDLSVSGTLDAPQLYRRIDLLPGGTLTYRVFGREFEIARGFVDFDGDLERPQVDVTAQTEVTYLARASSETQDEDEKEVVITLAIRGRVPDLKIEMSSDDSALDQADLQSLILTGRPRSDLDRSQGDSVVTADLANVLNNVLKAPFVRTASVGLSQRGDLQYNVGTCFGPDLCFSTTAVQETAETTLRAQFRLRLGDDVTCDGTLRRSDASVTDEESYEARCRYRIPLD